MALAKKRSREIQTGGTFITLNATWNSGWKIVKIESRCQPDLYAGIPALPDT